MGRYCLTCQSPHRDDVDLGLARGVPAAHLAQRYGLPERGVQRHRNAHLPLRVAWASSPLAGPTDRLIHDTLKSRLDQLERLMDERREDGDLMGAVLLSSESLRILEIFVRAVTEHTTIRGGDLERYPLRPPSREYLASISRFRPSKGCIADHR